MASFAASPGLSVLTCLSAERVSALFAGGASAEPSPDVDEHIDACAECRALVAHMARATAEGQRSLSGEPSLGDGVGKLSEIAALVGELAQRNAQRRVGTLVRGKWRFESLLGTGGMAEVYAATHSNGRKVAIKVLRLDLAQNATLCQRFLLEGHAANRVGHPGAIAILDHDVTEDGAPFLVMERLEGETLKARLARGPLSAKDIVQVAIAVLDVLASAHARGIVHRDIKPENLFLAIDRVKVLDFGIAQVRDLTGDVAATATGTSMGTPAYMSPEQARGETRRVDARTDVFAVGATMFVALAGRPIHAATGASEVMFLSMTQPVSPIAKVVAGIDTRLAHIIDRALSFDRDTRWDSAEAMRDALASYEPRPGALGSRVRGILVGTTGATALVASLAWTTLRVTSSPVTSPARGVEQVSAIAPTESTLVTVGSTPSREPIVESDTWGPPSTLATPSPSAVAARVSRVASYREAKPAVLTGAPSTAPAVLGVNVVLPAVVSTASSPAPGPSPGHPLDHRH